MRYFQKTYILLSLIAMTFLVFCFSSPTQFGADDGKIREIIKNVRRTLTLMHFAPQTIDQEFAHNAYDKYLENLDPYKNYFKPQDIEAFSVYRDQMDLFFSKEDLTFYHQSVDTLYRRMDELASYTEQLLERPLDFTKDETLNIDAKSATFAKTEAEWENNWKKRLKYNILQEIILLENSAADTALWAKRDSVGLQADDFDPRGKSFAQLEEKARTETAEQMSEFFRRFKQRKKSDWLSTYINSFTEQYDPHTSYFSPKENEDFEMSMSGQLEGIGATLADEKGYPTIKSLVVGGPAWKQGELEEEDQITKVAQGEGAASVNVVGMLLDDAIRLIRGRKGSTVVLTVRKKDGSMRDIKIVRDIVELEQTFARSAVIQNQKGEKYGILYLPSFYLNYDGKGHDASDDVKAEIEMLKAEGIQGLIFDVRGNGGGDLSETVEIVGHFVPPGPVVQVVRSDGDQSVLTSPRNAPVIWDGPMVVMVNEFSASASEILAAALQDYGRAVVVGSTKTYGKGTVQTVRPLSWFTSSKEEYGMIKFTIQKFYRINGGSTQLKGVASDIVLPDRYQFVEISEEAKENALAWDQIQPLKYQTWPKVLPINRIRENSERRISQKPEFQTVLASAKWMKELDDRKTVSLNYEKFRADFKRREAESKKFDGLSDYNNGLRLSSPAAEMAKIANDSVLGIRRQEWHNNLSSDLYVEESVNILRDLK
ncbi:MAG: carboxy terminal-processing peptidase [Weeksellaceae bacterium]|nr:carboxy terminal-processing peptidase [Weeksellaceae bacterium]